MLERQGNYWKTLTLGRIGTLLFIPLLILYVYRWSAELYGTWAGIVACVLMTFSPNILAHASLATVDFPAAAVMIAAGYSIYRWAVEPTLLRCTVAGVFVGIAVMTKYSAVVFLPPRLFGYFAVGQRHRLQERWSWSPVAIKAVLSQGVLFCFILVVVTLACFRGGQMRPITDATQRPHRSIDRLVSRETQVSTFMYWAVETIPVPLTDLVRGLTTVAIHADAGHPSFLLGERRDGGWWYYFPVVLAVKTTLPFLILLLVTIGSGVWRWKREGPGTHVYPALAALAILAVAMTSSINLGVRHILPRYPILAVLASGCFRPSTIRGRRRRRWLALGVILVFWHEVESLWAHPDYIAYFNQIARGHEHRILGDSNLDWGQDFHRLARYLEEQGIDEISLEYFGSGSPEAVGIENWKPFTCGDQPRGWVVSSVTRLQGIYEPACAWFEGRTPDARIGKSIWFFYVDPVSAK